MVNAKEYLASQLFTYGQGDSQIATRVPGYINRQCLAMLEKSLEDCMRDQRIQESAHWVKMKRAYMDSYFNGRSKLLNFDIEKKDQIEIYDAAGDFNQFDYDFKYVKAEGGMKDQMAGPNTAVMTAIKQHLKVENSQAFVDKLDQMYPKRRKEIEGIYLDGTRMVEAM